MATETPVAKVARSLTGFRSWMSGSLGTTRSHGSLHMYDSHTDLEQQAGVYNVLQKYVTVALRARILYLLRYPAQPNFQENNLCTTRIAPHSLGAQGKRCAQDFEGLLFMFPGEIMNEVKTNALTFPRRWNNWGFGHLYAETIAKNFVWLPVRSEVFDTYLHQSHCKDNIDVSCAYISRQLGAPVLHPSLHASV